MNITIKDFESFLNENIEDKSKANVVIVKRKEILEYYDEDSKIFMNKETAKQYYIETINNKFSKEYDNYDDAYEFYKTLKDVDIEIDLVSFIFVS